MITMQPYHGEHDVNKKYTILCLDWYSSKCVDTCGHHGAGSSNKDLQTLK